MRIVYLIGIGGVGMSALARYYKHDGCFVAGYDRVESEITRKLMEEGIPVHYTDDVNAIPAECKSGADKVLVIYTPAVPKEHGELNYFRNQGYEVVKRSAILGRIASTKKTLAVAGTHGKTTTSTLLAHLLTQASGGCTAFLGGISKNYGTNLLLSKSDYLVAEADEFDRSFLQLYPQCALVTAADADHLDIYGDENTLLDAFGDFVGQIKPGGTLVLKEGVNIPLKNKQYKVYRYSYNSPCDFYASNIRLLPGGYYEFDINLPNRKLSDCTLGIPGWVNIENAVGAVAVAWTVGFDDEKLKGALASFSGVQRRFDFHINTPACVYVDDYAHHPEELRAAISSLRQMFPGRKLTGVFQPHLYTRTRDFVDGFAESLSMLDSLILLDIYPAREGPIEGITSQIILDKVKIVDKQLCKKEDLLNILQNKDVDVLATFGAGDIDRLVAPIIHLLKDKMQYA